MVLYHGTSIDAKNSISEQGFNKTYGEYGTGIYLATTQDFAQDYGDEILEVFVDDEYITTLSQDDIDRIGIMSDMENYAHNSGILAFQIIHNNHQSEVVVYEDWIIEMVN